MFTNSQLIVGDYLNVHFNEKFDVIYSSLTFFHIEDKALAIKKSWSLLNSNVRFILTIDKNSQEYLEYDDYMVKMYPDDLENTLSLLDKCKFRIENVVELEFANIISAKKQTCFSF